MKDVWNYKKTNFFERNKENISQNKTGMSERQYSKVWKWCTITAKYYLSKPIHLAVESSQWYNLINQKDINVQLKES